MRGISQICRDPWNSWTKTIRRPSRAQARLEIAPGAVVRRRIDSPSALTKVSWTVPRTRDAPASSARGDGGGGRAHRGGGGGGGGGPGPEKTGGDREPPAKTGGARGARVNRLREQ